MAHRHASEKTSHQFDAGVVYQELGRCGLTELQQTWAKIARDAFCTMDPLLGRWVLLYKGQQVGAPYVNHTMRLKRILQLLLPEKARILENHHDAGTDAEMTRLVYVAALKLAKLAQG